MNTNQPPDTEQRHEFESSGNGSQWCVAIVADGRCGQPRAAAVHSGAGRQRCGECHSPVCLGNDTCPLHPLASTYLDETVPAERQCVAQEDLSVLPDDELVRRLDLHKAESAALADELAKVWRLRIRTGTATDEDKMRAAQCVTFTSPAGAGRYAAISNGDVIDQQQGDEILCRATSLDHGALIANALNGSESQ